MAQYASDYAGGVILVLLNMINNHSLFIVSGVDLAVCNFWGGSWYLSLHSCVLFMSFSRQASILKISCCILFSEKTILFSFQYRSEEASLCGIEIKATVAQCKV